MSNIELDYYVVLAKFINYMQKALYHRRLNYFKNLEKIQKNETSIEEANTLFQTDVIENIEETIRNIDFLNEKEKYLFNLHYKHGLSYEEISKITNEKVCTLKQRRNRN